MKNHSTAFSLSVIIVLLAAIAAAGGLLINGLYRDNAFVTNAWLALSPAFGKWDPLLPFYVLLIIGGLTGSLILLKNYSSSKI